MISVAPRLQKTLLLYTRVLNYALTKVHCEQEFVLEDVFVLNIDSVDQMRFDMMEMICKCNSVGSYKCYSCSL